MVNKRECLDCLFTEINILTECRHPNVVKILDASFDGTIIKEQEITIIPPKKAYGWKQKLSDRSRKSDDDKKLKDHMSPMDTQKGSPGVSNSTKD